MKRLVMDVEGDDLLPGIKNVWCICTHDPDTGVDNTYPPDRLAEGLEALQSADLLIGHNIIGFDLPALQKVLHVDLSNKATFDTLVYAKLAYPDIYQSDTKLVARGTLPAELAGRYSLKSFGYRLGFLKGTYGERPDVFKTYSPELLPYCEGDVGVTRRLYASLTPIPVSPRAFAIEQATARILLSQELWGFKFNIEKAQALEATLLSARAGVGEEITSSFPVFVDQEVFVPKVNNKTRGYVKGVPTIKVHETAFNPSSRHHIVRYLKERYQWEPEEFTEAGQPKVDDEILGGLARQWPELTPLATWLMLEKRLGQLSEGEKAWLKFVQPDGRIHGSVNPCGCCTRRMSHSNPNLAQVPACDSPYGPECRELFEVRPGYKLVGCDASGLEARIMGHYFAPIDGGAFAKAAVSGVKEEGTDIHTINMKMLEITSRNRAKTWFYAYIYGAGDKKLAKILGCSVKEAQAKRALFEKRSPIGVLKEQIQAVAKARGYLIALDGGFIPVRSPHGAMNALFQCGGAVVMKVAQVHLAEQIMSSAFDTHFCVTVHDEWQMETLEAHAEPLGKTAVASIRYAGEALNLRCPLDGEYKIGNNWKETH